MKKLVTKSNRIMLEVVNEGNGIATGMTEDVTDDALDAVYQHLISMNNFPKTGFAGYVVDKTVMMAVFNDTHVCISKKLFEELEEYKVMYEDLTKHKQKRNFIEILEKENVALDFRQGIELMRKMEKNSRREKVANMTLEEKVDFLLEELYIKK